MPDTEQGFMSVKEAAEALKVSDQTIKRRIKAGEYTAEQRPLPGGGYMWVLPRQQVQAAIQNIEVIPVTRQVSVSELQQSIQQAVTEAVATQTAELTQRIDALTSKMDKQEDMLNNHYRLVDERLRQIMEAKQQAAAEQQQQKKSFWSRLFGG